MIIKWLDASAEKQFGASLAHFFMEKNSVNEFKTKTKFVAKKKKDVLNEMAKQVSRFTQEHKLNIYKKAQLGNSFKWTLKEAGYDTQYVDQLTNWLMLRF